MIIDINPVALELGFLKIHWYGIMYLIAFLSAYWLGIIRARVTPGWNRQQISDLIFYGALGVIIGGRIGYMLFYSFYGILENPLNILKIWQGGMSFHGGAIGVLIAGVYFTKKYHKKYLDVVDFIVPLVPIGIAAGRFGNFINGELWGKATDVIWGMKFATDRLGLVRHPSMLYEMILEGFVLFIILWTFSSKPKPRGSVLALAMICYGIFRFLIEFIREPDSHLGYLAWGWLTMGQILSAPLIVLGFVIFIWSYKTQGIRNASLS